jgi:flagellar basal-body rod modification protein FlgD
MEPMQDTEFIAQMASFTSLEQMKELNEGFSEFAAAQQSLLMPQNLGRNVTANTPDGPLTGVVSAVGSDDNGDYLEVDGQRIRPDQVVRISTPEEV